MSQKLKTKGDEIGTNPFIQYFFLLFLVLFCAFYIILYIIFIFNDLAYDINAIWLIN